VSLIFHSEGTQTRKKQQKLFIVLQVVLRILPCFLTDPQKRWRHWQVSVQSAKTYLTC